MATLHFPIFDAELIVLDQALWQPEPSISTGSRHLRLKAFPDSWSYSFLYFRVGAHWCCEYARVRDYLRGYGEAHVLLSSRITFIWTCHGLWLYPGFSSGCLKVTKEPLSAQQIVFARPTSYIVPVTLLPLSTFSTLDVRARMSAWPLATYSPSKILWLTSRLVPSSASESISSSSCGYASHTAWRFRCERGFQQHQTRRPKTSKTSLGIVQRLLLSTKGILHHHRDILCVVLTGNVTVLLRVCTFRQCAYFFLLRCGRLVPESDGIPSSLASNQNISPSSWSCLHCGFAADYLQCRHQGRSTQVFSSSRELTFIFDTHVLF